MTTSRTAQLDAVIRQVRRLFHRLARAADDAHREIGLTASQRGVLEALVEQGEQTVPSIARDKRVSRQHVQILVNALVEAEFAEPRDNPAHKRSPLIRVTERGRRQYVEVRRREEAILSDMLAHLDAGGLRVDQVPDVLAAMSTYLDELPNSQGRDIDEGDE